MKVIYTIIVAVLLSACGTETNTLDNCSDDKRKRIIKAMTNPDSRLTVEQTWKIHCPKVNSFDIR